MERMTLREAAEKTSKSITTLRRYIRSGRLPADKQSGRFGPEYFVSEQGLAAAGLDTPHPTRSAPALPVTPSAATSFALERVFRESVPMALYQELHLKHEQLLVQYGMVRVGGLRALEIQGELEAKKRQVEILDAQVAHLKEKLVRETASLQKRLRESELEIEAKSLEIAALQEKVRALEMITRNAVTNETVEKQFSQVVEQLRRVERLRRIGPEGSAGSDH